MLSPEKLNEIIDTINTLESGSLTYDSCDKLAAMYTILNQHNKSMPKEVKDKVTAELSDIFPAYQNYVESKTKFALKSGTKESVIHNIEILSIEIVEFIDMLYSSTDTVEERTIIKNILNQLYSKY